MKAGSLFHPWEGDYFADYHANLEVRDGFVYGINQNIRLLEAASLAFKRVPKELVNR